MTRPTVVLVFAILFAAIAFFLNIMRFDVEECTLKEYATWVIERIILALALSLCATWCFLVEQGMA